MYNIMRFAVEKTTRLIQQFKHSSPENLTNMKDAGVPLLSVIVSLGHCDLYERADECYMVIPAEVEFSVVRLRLCEQKPKGCVVLQV